MVGATTLAAGFGGTNLALPDIVRDRLLDHAEALAKEYKKPSLNVHNLEKVLIPATNQLFRWITETRKKTGNASLGRDSPPRENDAFRFGTEHGDTEYANRYCNDHDRQGLGIVAAPTFGQTRLDCCISAAEQISKLISKTRERDPSIRRREFIQISWNYTPGALDQELHRESPGCQPEWTGRERPQGNDRQS